MVFSISMRPSYYTAALLAFLAVVPSQAPAQEQPSAPKSEYMVFLKGTPIGSEEVAVTRDQAYITITGSNRIGPPVSLQVRKVTIRYDTSWAPIDFALEATIRDQWTSVYTKIDQGVATSDVREIGRQDTRTAKVAADAVFLPNTFFGSYEALAARLAKMVPGAETQVFVVPQAVLTVRLNEAAAEQLRTGASLMAARRYRITIMNPGVPLDAEVWTDTAGSLLRFSVPAQSIEVVRSDIATVSTRREALTRANDEQVMVAANGFNLASTISKPAVPPPAPGAKLPAVILVSGSGVTDRDETVGGVSIFAQLAGHLADAGFIVVRYDRRGVGQSGGRSEAATLSDYAEDVRAAVKYLDKRKDVDRKRIAVVGYGEGGWVSLLAAASEDKIAAVGLLSTAGTTGSELLLEQQRHLLERLDLPAAEKAARIDLQTRIQQAVVTGRGWEGIQPAVRDQADTPWFQSLLVFDPTARIKKVKRPILVVHGDLDREVPPQHAEAIRAAASARKPRAGQTIDLVKIAGANHLLVPATTGEVDEYGKLPGRALSREALGAVSAWLRKTFGL